MFTAGLCEPWHVRLFAAWVRCHLPPNWSPATLCQAAEIYTRGSAPSDQALHLLAGVEIRGIHPEGAHSRWMAPQGIPLVPGRSRLHRHAGKRPERRLRGRNGGGGALPPRSAAILARKRQIPGARGRSPRGKPAWALPHLDEVIKNREEVNSTLCPLCQNPDDRAPRSANRRALKPIGYGAARNSSGRIETPAGEFRARLPPTRRPRISTVPSRSGADAYFLVNSI